MYALYAFLLLLLVGAALYDWRSRRQGRAIDSRKFAKSIGERRREIRRSASRNLWAGDGPPPRR